LHILENFEMQEEWVLEPGDMLYIPPGVAHWGVAQGDCMTYSIGFRAPSHASIIDELSHDIAQALNNDLRFSDPYLKLQKNPGEIGNEAIAQIQDIIQQHFTAENIAHWFGKHMTERKYGEDDNEHDDEITADDWQAALAEGNMLWRHPAARVAFYTQGSETQLFADGRAIHCSRELAELVCSQVEINWDQLKPLMEDLFDRAAITQLINQETLLVDE
jgi:50S ribosomal protein L16 3-hydroxylase